MGLCEVCGTVVPDNRDNCPTCGQIEHRAVPCAHCGYPVLPRQERCLSCGFPTVKRSRPARQGSTAEARRRLEQASKTVYTGRSWLDLSFSAQEPVAAEVEPQDAACDNDEYSKRTDPYFLAAFVLGAASLLFTWMPNVGLGLAGAAIIVALLGYQRYFSYRQRGRYKGLWVNYLATVAGIVGLAMGFHFTPFV
jgi:ribosomal protein L37E